jgi:hypothetical protein
MSGVPKRTEMAFEYARDTSKQLTALATGVIALTATFSKEYVANTPQNLERYVIISWILLLVSVGCGQWCIMSLTGILGSQKTPPPPLSVYTKSIQLPAILQVVSFFTGLCLIIAFAVNVLNSSSSDERQSGQLSVVPNTEIQP